MKNTFKAIFITIVLMLMVSGCSSSNSNIVYGGDEDNGFLFGRCIMCGDDVYVSTDTLPELPEDSEYLGQASERTTQVVNDVKLVDVSVINQSVFPDTMYAVTMDENTGFYISPDRKTIYCQRPTGTYNVYEIQ